MFRNLYYIIFTLCNKKEGARGEKLVLIRITVNIGVKKKVFFLHFNAAFIGKVVLMHIMNVCVHVRSVLCVSKIVHLLHLAQFLRKQKGY